MSILDSSSNWIGGPSAAGHIRELLALDEPRKLRSLEAVAIDYAHSLALESPRALAYRLYMFNTAPASLSWLRSFAAPDAYDTFLGLGPGTDLDRILDPWRPAQHRDGAWRHFQRRGAVHAGRRENMHKIYVSPTHHQLGKVFPIVARRCVAESVLAFKVANGPRAALRSDKLVLYATSQEQAEKVISELSAELEGVPAQGVPFTERAGASGLLSAGVDPPLAERPVEWGTGMSWRLWVCRHLASSLISCRGEPAVEPGPYCQFRLALDGVDPVEFRPRDSSWSAMLGRSR